VLDKIRRIPHPGLRNIKTAIAATFCVVLYGLIGRNGVALACITVFICMQESVDKAFRVSIDRTLGTLLGGALGIAASMLHVLDRPLPILGLVIFVGIVLYIFACSLLRLEGAIPIGLATYVIIIMGPQFADVPPIPHALNRTLDTLIGIVVAFLVNLLLFRPRPERFRGHETVNPIFHYEYRKASHHKTVKWDGGYTWEMYIYPEDAIDQNLDFDFRVSSTVRPGGVSMFPKFPGYKRRVMLLDGELQVRHPGHHDIVLGPYEQDCHMGDWETECVGTGTELSLLTAEQCSGQLELLYSGDKLELDNGQFTSFYSLTDGVKFCFTHGGKRYKEEMGRGDYLFVSWYKNGEAPYTLEISHGEEMDRRPLALMISCKYREQEEV